MQSLDADEHLRLCSKGLREIERPCNRSIARGSSTKDRQPFIGSRCNRDSEATTPIVNSTNVNALHWCVHRANCPSRFTMSRLALSDPSPGWLSSREEELVERWWEDGAINEPRTGEVVERWWEDGAINEPRTEPCRAVQSRGQSRAEPCRPRSAHLGRIPSSIKGSVSAAECRSTSRAGSHLGRRHSKG
jgi:hypothetical protein